MRENFVGAGSAELGTQSQVGSGVPDRPNLGWEFRVRLLLATLFHLSVDSTIIRPCADTITARKQGNSLLTGLSAARCRLCNNFLMKIVEQWLLFRYIEGQFTPLSKPFKTKDQAEKARLKLPERERRGVAVGVIKIQK